MMQPSPNHTPAGGVPPARPNTAQTPTPPHGTRRPKRSVRRNPRPIVTVAMVFAIIACVLTANISLSAGGGALAGQRDRNVWATQTTEAEVDLQYELALTDISETQYGISAQRLRWVLDRQPNYADAAEQLIQVEQQITSSAFQPTVPPPGSDEPDILYTEAQAFAAAEEWASTLARIDQLQVIAPDYRFDDVQELKFTALEALGLIYVRSDRIEEGLFLLEQASAIMPLSDTAEGEQNLAELYSDAQIYIDLDWAVVVDKYQQIYNLAPNYRNFPFEFQIALSEYGRQLEDSAQYCDAVIQYEYALSLFADPDPLIAARLEGVGESCENSASVSRTVTPVGTASATAGVADDDDDGMISPSDLDDDDNGTRTPTATLNPLVPTPVLPGN